MVPGRGSRGRRPRTRARPPPRRSPLPADATRDVPAVTPGGYAPGPPGPPPAFSRRTPAAGPRPGPPRRRRGLWAVVALAAVVILAAVGYFVAELLLDRGQDHRVGPGR